MSNDLNSVIETLKDSANGWVTRRDAAEALGKIGGKALAALKAHADEKDVDVRAGVERALAAFQELGNAPAAGTAPPSLKSLALACEKKLRRAVKAQGDGYVVRVQLKEGRNQDVHITPHKGPDGRELIRVSTQCGEPDADTIAWAIRSNSQLMYCAFSIETKGDQEHLVIVKNFNPHYVTAAMVKDAVKEIAFYGDWLEKKLSGEDKF